MKHIDVTTLANASFPGLPDLIGPMGLIFLGIVIVVGSIRLFRQHASDSRRVGTANDQDIYAALNHIRWILLGFAGLWIKANWALLW